MKDGGIINTHAPRPQGIMLQIVLIMLFSEFP